MKNINIHKSKIFLAIIALTILSTLTFAATSQAAAMPDYERLQALNVNLTGPSGVAIDSYENIYVADSKANRLVIYNSDGTFADMISGLDVPISVAVGNGRIYVGNGGSGDVSVYDLNRNFIMSLRGASRPASLAVDGAGKVYVVDSDNDVVNVYNSDGSSDFSFGGSGSADGSFHFPTSIAINKADGEIVVSDLQANSNVDMFGRIKTLEGARIQVFDLDGNHKRSFGEYGIGPTKIFRPTGVDVDEEGRIYVTDVFQNIVQVYDAAGAHLGSIFDNANPMRSPVDITISNSNKLYIASFYTYAVEVYRITDDRPAYAAVVPNSHDFGEAYVGSTSGTQVFTIYNIGNGNLDLGDVVIAGADAGDFVVQADSCSGSSLVPATDCNIIVAMSAVSEGAKSAEIRIASNGDTVVAAISGSAVTAPNQAPVADAGGPYSVDEGSNVAMDASGSSDSDGTIVTYAWDLDNNGTYETIGNPMTFDAASADGPMGPFTVGLQVTDNLGATATDTAMITVNNAPPTADAGGPYSGEPGVAVTLSGSATDPSAADILSYAWDLDGDGLYETSGANVQFTYNSAGDYAVGLRVTDDDGGVGIDTAQVVITEVVLPVPAVDISLNAGWNLIGWVSDMGYYKGVEPQQNEYASGTTMNSVASLDEALAQAGLGSSDYRLIIGPGGKVHIPGSLFSTLKTLLPDRAYWIFANQDMTINLPGEIIPLAATSTLPAGWTPIGYRGFEGENPSDALRCIEGNYDLVVSGKGKVFIVGFPYSNLTSMHQGKGYFIHMATEGTLTYDCP